MCSKWLQEGIDDQNIKSGNKFKIRLKVVGYACVVTLHDMGKLQKGKNIIKPIISQKRCIKRGFQGIHDRFWIDSEFRASQLDHGPDEEVCIEMDELADKNFSHYGTQAECFEYKQNWWISLSVSLESLDH